jgi:type I restriction enzyme S subunit
MSNEKCLDELIKKDETSESSKDWKLVEIGTLVKEFQSGFACAKSNIVENGVSHLRPNNIGYYGKLNFFHIVYLPSKMVNLQKYSLKAGDILFNNTNSKELVGRASLVKEDLEGGFSNHITRLRIDKGLITSEWLVNSINYLWSQGYFLKQCRKWIGQAGINTQMLKTVKIPVPPLNVQKRIVARIEQLTLKIDQAKRLREEALEDTEAIMQAGLRQTFRDQEQKGWEMKKLEEIGKVSSGGTPSRHVKEYFGGNIDWFKARELNGSYLYSSEEKITEDALHNSSAKLLPKDTIIIGMYDTAAGKLGMLTSQATTNQACAAIEIGSIAMPKYVLYALRHFRRRLIEKRRGIRQQNLNLGMIKSFGIPVPAVKEQEQIVASLDKLQKKVNELQEQQETVMRDFESMTQSVLRMAFSGKL